MGINNLNKIREGMNAYGRNGTPFFFALNFDVTEGILIENPLEQKEILFEIRGKGNKETVGEMRKEYRFEPIPIERETYNEMFSMVHDALDSGLISVVNLTVKTPLDTDLSLHDVFEKSTSLYQVYVPNRFVCFSPEQFVRIADGKIYTNPMKGTIDASIPDAERLILDSEKERKEHTLVVEMVKEELQVVANDVQIGRFRYVDRIKTATRDILQTSSEVVGTLPSDYLSHLGDIIFKMLPASSILGVPKREAKSVIDAVEPRSRGYYTGVCGYFDGQELNSGVLIRFIEEDGDKKYFRSGGGVTINSDAESEYKEVLNKIYIPK